MWESESGSGGPLAAGWVKRRYVVQGDYLRPVAGFPNEPYNPFDWYYGTDSVRADRSLYLQLIDLDLDDIRAIEDFASRWGLLGLFQHRLVQASHLRSDGPHTSNFDNTPLNRALFMEYAWPGCGRLSPTSELISLSASAEFQFSRDGRSFEISPLPPDLEEDLVKSGCCRRDQGHVWLNPGYESAFEGLVLAWNEAQRKRWQETQRFADGSVIYRDEDDILRECSREEYYRRYFPDPVRLLELAEEAMQAYRSVTGENFDHDKSIAALMRLVDRANPAYPSLGSDLLWEGLCEPLDDFRHEVLSLRRTYDLASRANDPLPPRPTLEAGIESAYAWDQAHEERGELKAHLERQMQRVHPTPTVRGEWTTWSWTWQFPSLLSAAYTMLFLDFAVAGRKLRFCASETCGKSFPTDRTDRKYCSLRCQNAQKQRDFRRANPKPKGASQ